MKIVFVALSYDTHDVTSFAARKVERDDSTRPKTYHRADQKDFERYLLPSFVGVASSTPADIGYNC